MLVRNMGCGGALPHRFHRTIARRSYTPTAGAGIGLTQEGAESMAKAMTKSQVMAALAEELEISKKDAVRFVETLVNLAYKEAPNGFTIPGLGKLVVVNRKARMGRNPQTGEPLHIPAKTVLKFRIAKAAKDTCL